MFLFFKVFFVVVSVWLFVFYWFIGRGRERNICEIRQWPPPTIPPQGWGGSVTDDREPGDLSVQGTKPYQRAALVSFTLASRYSPGSDTARDRQTDLRVRDVCEKYIKCKSVFAQPLVTIQPKCRLRGARRCWRLWVPQGALVWLEVPGSRLLTHTTGTKGWIRLLAGAASKEIWFTAYENLQSLKK